MKAQSRFQVAIGTSLIINAIVWASVGSALAYKVVTPPPIEFQRIVINREGKRTVKVVNPEEVKKKVERVVKVRHTTPPPEKRAEPKPVVRKSAPPPQGAHNKVLTASRKPSAPSKPQDFTALAGGNAAQGKPTEAQAPGTAAVNPPNPPKIEPPPAPKTEPKVTPPADPPKVDPPKVDPPKVDPPKIDPPKIDPPKVDPPKKKGPSRDAQHSNEVNPTIPDSLKDQEFKKFVRVRVDIDADGSFKVTLRTSSGNEEVDRRVLEALKRWTWKPKLVDGDPVESTQLFRFDFEVK